MIFRFQVLVVAHIVQFFYFVSDLNNYELLQIENVFQMINQREKLLALGRLKTRQQVIDFCRLMVRGDDFENKMKLLELLLVKFHSLLFFGFLKSYQVGYLNDSCKFIFLRETYDLLSICQTLNFSGSPNAHMFVLLFERKKVLTFTQTFAIFLFIHSPFFTMKHN